MTRVLNRGKVLGYVEEAGQVTPVFGISDSKTETPIPGFVSINGKPTNVTDTRSALAIQQAYSISGYKMGPMGTR